MTENRTRIRRNNLPDELRDYSLWPQVDPETLKGKRKKVFLRRYKAVTRYMDGEKVEAICDSVPISRAELIRMRDRCLEIVGPNGEVAGFPALLYYSRQKEYERGMEVRHHKEYGNRGGRAGALTQVFQRFPSIKRYLEATILKRKGELGPEALESRIPIKAIHKKFIKLCRKKNIKGSEYPFNAVEHGRRAIGDFVRKTIESHPKEAVAARYGHDAAVKLGSEEEATRRYASSALEREEFDAHKLDANWTLRMPDRFHGYIEIVLERIWLLVVLDEYSRAVLGYLLCLSNECSQYDVLRCFKRAVEPWQPRDLSAIPGLKYLPGSGLPSGVLASYRWALWRFVTYDNAQVNLAKWVRSLLRNTLGCAVNPGPVTTKDHQPFVERFFGTLEQTIHRLPNTTGSRPDDPLRIDPEGAALEYSMSVEELRAFTDHYMATYNVTPHEGLDYLTPMEVLEREASREEFLIRHLPEKKRKQLWWLNERKTAKVCGILEEGRRPYVNFYGARYSSDVLRNSPWLIGDKLTLTFDPTSDDCRQIMAFLKNGEPIGLLSVRGNWARSSHSLELRKEITKLKKQKNIFYEEHDDPVEVYLAYKAKQARTQKRGRGKLGKAMEQGAGRDKPPAAPPLSKGDSAATKAPTKVPDKYTGKKGRIL